MLRRSISDDSVDLLRLGNIFHLKLAYVNFKEPTTCLDEAAPMIPSISYDSGTFFT